MRSAASLTEKFKDEMKAAYAAEDPVSFTAAAMGLKEFALTAIAGGFHHAGSQALSELCHRMEDVVAHRKEDRPDQRGRVSQEFVMAVMPLFGINSREVSQNLGTSSQIDDYLFSSKINFAEMTYDNVFGTFMFYALRRNLFDEFVTGFGGACSELLQRQTYALNRTGVRVADCFRYSEQTTLLRVFERIGNAGLTMPELPKELDEMLATALTNLCVGDASSLTYPHIKGMQAGGLHKSVNAALRNVYSLVFNLDTVALGAKTLEDSAYFLGMNSKSSHGPNLVRELIGYDPVDVRKAMHPMTYKQSACNPANLLKSCAEYISSPDYQPGDLPVINVLLETAYAKIKKTHKFKRDERDFEVFRVHLSAAGIPNQIQFKLPMIKDHKARILEIEMGM